MKFHCGLRKYFSEAESLKLLGLESNLDSYVKYNCIDLLYQTQNYQ